MKSFNVFTPLTLLTLLLFTLTAHAENGLHSGLSVSAAVGLSKVDIINDAPTRPDFNNSTYLQLNINYALNEWFEIDTGIISYQESKTEKMTDLAGTYQLATSANALQLGGRFLLNVDNDIRAYFRLGGSYYRVNLEVNESFDDIKESGKDSANSSGKGYYYGVGIITNASKNLEIQMEYLGQHLSDVFEDSSRPFDIRYKGVTLGARYNF